MAMKRRGFLQMLGAAVAAPMMPAAGTAMPANIGGLAAAHAKTYPFVSATGLSKRLGLSISQAQKVLLDLSNRGLVGEVTVCGTGPAHAASKVFVPCEESLIRLAQARKAARDVRAAKLKKAAREAACQMQVDLTALMRHLQGVCVGNGMALQPRAIAVTA